MRLVRVLYIQAVIAALALCVVWQGNQARQAGYRQERLQRKIVAYMAEAQEYRAQISKLKSPQRIIYLVNYLGLGLRQARTGPAMVATNGSLESNRGVPEASSEVAIAKPSH